MRENYLKPDKDLIEEICQKYGESVREAVTKAVASKNIDFQKTHKPIYEIEDYKKYYRHLIQLNPNVAMLIHLFQKDNDDSWESVWLNDNEQHAAVEYDCMRESAHQLILQLEGHWCDLFIEALRDECDKILKESAIQQNKMKNKK